MNREVLMHFAINLGISIIAVLAPAKGMILTSFFLVGMDLITGIAASMKQKHPITSAGLGRSVVKAVVYELAIILAFLTQQYLTGPMVPCASIVAGFIGLTELKSVLENLEILSGGQLLEAIIQKLGSKNLPERD